MYKTKTRNRHAESDYDIYGDLENIKAALAATSRDVKGRAGEVLARSLENVRERSAAAQDNAAEFVSKKPFVSVTVATLTGLVIGYLLNIGRK